MGYSTKFTGAFKITPMVDHTHACRLNAWLQNRHHVRENPVPPDELNDRTLFGTPGEDGEYVMPSIEQQITQLVADGINPFVAPHLTGAGAMGDGQECKAAFAPTATMDDETKQQFVNNWCKNDNQIPAGCPSHWSDFIIINDMKEGCSYLKWNGSEKSDEMDKWAQILLDLLVAKNYALDGTICAKGEDAYDYWSMQICGATVRVEYCKRDSAATYANEAEVAMKRSEKAAKSLDISEELAINLIRVWPSTAPEDA